MEGGSDGEGLLERRETRGEHLVVQQAVQLALLLALLLAVKRAVRRAPPKLEALRLQAEEILALLSAARFLAVSKRNSERRCRFSAKFF